MMQPVHGILGGSAIIALSILLTGMWVVDKLEGIEKRVRYIDIELERVYEELVAIKINTDR